MQNTKKLFGSWEMDHQSLYVWKDMNHMRINDGLLESIYEIMTDTTFS